MPENEPGPSEDWDLAGRARSGDESAYETLIGRYQNPIHSFIFRSVGNEETARDLAQEVFVRAWFALPKVKATGKFSTWLFQIAVNLCRDEVKSKAARQGRVTESLAGDAREDGNAIERDIPQTGLQPDEAAENTEAVERLETEIRGLPDELREAFLLGAVEGYSQKEIGEALGISAKAVETRIYRARKVLMERAARFAA